MQPDSAKNKQICLSLASSLKKLNYRYEIESEMHATSQPKPCLGFRGILMGFGSGLLMEFVCKGGNVFMKRNMCQKNSENIEEGLFSSIINFWVLVGVQLGCFCCVLYV
jgi:hypothetical protein